MAKQTKSVKAVKTAKLVAVTAAEPVKAPVVMEETATERIARKRAAAAAAKDEPIKVQAAAAKAEPVAVLTGAQAERLATISQMTLTPKAAKRAAKALAAKPVATKGKPAPKPATAHTAAKPATKASSAKAAPVPCSKCGRQNPQNADCRVASACARRVRQAKEGKKAAPAAAEARA